MLYADSVQLTEKKTAVDAHMQLVLDLMNRFRPTNDLYTAFDSSAWSPS